MDRQIAEAVRGVIGDQLTRTTGAVAKQVALINKVNKDLEKVGRCCEANVPREWDGSFLNECCSSSDYDDKMKKKCHPQWFGGTKSCENCKEVWRPESRACLSSTAMQAWCKEEVGTGNPRLLYNKKCDRWSDFAKIDKGQVRDQAITEYCTDVVNTKHENEWDVLPDAPDGTKRRNAACDCWDPESVPADQKIAINQRMYSDWAEHEGMTSISAPNTCWNVPCLLTQNHSEGGTG